MCYRKLANCFDRVTAGVDINAASNVLAMVLPLCLQRSEGDEPAANFIFACPCKAISVGVEAHGKLSYNPHTRCCGGPCPDYPSVVLQKQVVGAFIWSPVLGMLIRRRQAGDVGKEASGISKVKVNDMEFPLETEIFQK